MDIGTALSNVDSHLNSLITLQNVRLCFTKEASPTAFLSDFGYDLNGNEIIRVVEPISYIAQGVGIAHIHKTVGSLPPEVHRQYVNSLKEQDRITRDDLMQNKLYKFSSHLAPYHPPLPYSNVITQLYLNGFREYWNYSVNNEGRELNCLRFPISITGYLEKESDFQTRVNLSDCTMATIDGDDFVCDIQGDLSKVYRSFSSVEQMAQFTKILLDPLKYTGQQIELAGVLIGKGYRHQTGYDFYLIPNELYIDSNYLDDYKIYVADNGMMSEFLNYERPFIPSHRFTHTNYLRLKGNLNPVQNAPHKLEIDNITSMSILTERGTYNVEASM